MHMVAGLRSVKKADPSFLRLLAWRWWIGQSPRGAIAAAGALFSPLALAQSRGSGAGIAHQHPPATVLLDSGASNILQILAEMSWDTLFLLVGLAFVAVAVLGNISGRIRPGKQGRIAAAVVGSILVAGGIWYHVMMHGFSVTDSMVSTPNGPISGTCPMAVNLQGIVDASGTGDVIYQFQFSNGNASDLKTLNFQKTDSQIVTGVWQVPESVTDAWVRLNIAAPRRMVSNRSGSFSVTCIGGAAAGTYAPQTGKFQPAPSLKAAPPPHSVLVPVSGASPAIPPHVVNDSLDSVALTSVQPPPGTYLKSGQPVTFNLGVSYNLATAESAILSISTVQIRTSGAGCNGQDDELVDAVEIPIVHGKHEAKVRLTWSGDTGAATKGRIYGQGYLSFSPMFWASNNGARGARLDYFGTYAEHCYPFGR